MKLKSNFVTHKTGENYILICTDTKAFSGMVKLNETAEFIVELLKNEMSFENILSEMKKKYNADEKIMAEDIESILKTLKKVGAIE